MVLESIEAPVQRWSTVPSSWVPTDVNVAVPVPELTVMFIWRDAKLFVRFASGSQRKPRGVPVGCGMGEPETFGQVPPFVSCVHEGKT